MTGRRLSELRHKGYITDAEYEEIKNALKEQDPIFHKIILELEQAQCGCENDSYCRGINYGLYIAIQIINKYCRRDYHE